MVIVAVAGGSGDLGRTIVQAIEKCPQHTVFVLTRKRSVSQLLTVYKKSQSKTIDKQVDARNLELDYTSVENIASILETNKIHTVISTIQMNDQHVATAQVNLIRGAEKASTVRRFAPSEFNVDYNQPDSTFPYVHKALFRNAVNELERCKTLEFTLFRNGLFMDYFGLPHTVTNLRPLYVLVDIPSSKAVIPGDGNAPITCTYSFDVAKAVAFSLDLAAWPRETAIIGQSATPNEIIAIAEEVTGRTIEKTYVPLEDLRAMKPGPDLPSNAEAFQSWEPLEVDPQMDAISASMSLGMALGGMEVKRTGFEKLVPEFKPLTIEEFLRSTWGGQTK